MLKMIAGPVCAVLLAACAMAPPPPIVQQPMSARPPALPQAVPTSGAIYGSGRGYTPLFEDRRARHVGDTLVVVISEKTAANKKGESQVERTSELKAAVPLLQGVPGKSVQGLSVEGTSSNKFDGSGQSSSNNDFTGTISVTVTEVLSNGNMVVSGEKQIAMSEGTEYIRFSGVINPRTIALGNTVNSSQVADARIEYKATGYMDSARVMGWLARFFLTFLPF